MVASMPKRCFALGRANVQVTPIWGTTVSIFSDRACVISSIIVFLIWVMLMVSILPFFFSVIVLVDR